MFVCHSAGDEEVLLDGVPHKGYSLPVADRACLLPARDHEHVTLPWTGRRLVLVVFSVHSRAGPGLTCVLGRIEGSCAG